VLKSIALRLMSSFLVIIVIISAIFSYVGIRFIENRVVTETQNRVAESLMAAGEIYGNELHGIQQVTRLTGDRIFLKDALRSGRAGRAGASGEVRDKHADHQTIDEPLYEVLAQRWRSAGDHREQANRPAFELLHHLRLLHFLVGRVREMVRAAGSHARRTQGVQHAVFVWKLAVVALVDGEHHVQDRTGNKDDHGRKQDGEP
jgi:hypothetical protein